MPRGIPHSVFLDWDEHDQDKAIAWMREQKLKCNGCGTQEADWAEDRFAYVADTDRCAGCEVLEQERENIPPGQKGVRVFLAPRAVVEARMQAEAEELADGVS